MRDFLKAIITAPFLQTKIDEYFDKRATAGLCGASPGSGRPVWIVVLLVLAVVAVIAIVVAYWAEILFVGLAALGIYWFYRKRIAAGMQAEPIRPAAAQGTCGNCHKPSESCAPFCKHCGSHMASPPEKSVSLDTSLPVCPQCGNTDLEQFLYLENALVCRRLIGVVGKTLRVQADYTTGLCSDEHPEEQDPRLMCTAQDCEGGCFPVPAGLKLALLPGISGPEGCASSTISQAR
jgi:hypothetical protein